jgi:hypothetical protein
LVLITRQENVVLPIAKPIVVDVPMVVRVRYNEPIINLQNGSNISGVPRG